MKNLYDYWLDSKQIDKHHFSTIPNGYWYISIFVWAYKF